MKLFKYLFYFAIQSQHQCQQILLNYYYYFFFCLFLPEVVETVILKRLNLKILVLGNIL